jgi:hypothetical protein
MTEATNFSSSFFPVYLLSIFAGLKSKSTEFVSVATAFTIKVFPVPAGP